jgi:hypothetical protein
MTELKEQHERLGLNTKQQLDLANQKIVDQRGQIDRLNTDLQDKNQRLDNTTSDFNGRDREFVQVSVEKSDLQKQTATLSADNRKLS